MTDRSRAVTYFFWIPLISDLDSAREFYLRKGLKTKSVPTNCASWELSYGSSQSLAPMYPELTSSMPETVTPKMPAKKSSRA